MLQLALLAAFHVGKLIDVHQQVVRQCHIGIKLVGKVDVIQIIGSQLRGQQAHGESCLATTLSANQYGSHFVTMQVVEAQPMGYHRAQPG